MTVITQLAAMRVVAQESVDNYRKADHENEFVYHLLTRAEGYLAALDDVAKNLIGVKP